MYKITSQGKLLAICDKPRYVCRKASTGAWIATEKDKAEGVCVKTQVYSIHGKQPVEGLPVAVVREVDGGEFIFGDLQSRVTVPNHRADIAALENAICDLDELIEGGAL